LDTLTISDDIVGKQVLEWTSQSYGAKERSKTWVRDLEKEMSTASFRHS